MNQYKTVLLSGSLAALFGRAHRLVIDTPAEACRALSVTIPGFEAFMQNAHLKGLRFAVFKGRQNITKEELKQKLADINKLCNSDEILDMKVRFCKGEVGKTRPIAQEFQTLYDLLLSMKF